MNFADSKFNEILVFGISSVDVTWLGYFDKKNSYKEAQIRHSIHYIKCKTYNKLLAYWDYTSWGSIVAQKGF